MEFVGWCDLNAQTAAQRQAQVGGAGEIFTDGEEMLDQIDVDAVYIMLPPFAHGPVEDLILERGLPFFIEKPVAIDLAVAERVAAHVKEQELITSVGFCQSQKERARAHCVFLHLFPMGTRAGMVAA